MDPNIVISGKDLFKHYFSVDRSVPKKGGHKEVEVDGSWIQAKRLSTFYEDRHSLLAEERVEKLVNLVKGTWNPERSLVEFEREIGKFWSNMGFVDKHQKWLYPEEALFLMESNALEVSYNEIPLSIEEAYSMFINGEFQLEEYQVYSHLRRYGYLVRRHKSLATDYEVSIKITQHVSKSKKRKRKKKNGENNGIEKENTTLTICEDHCESEDVSYTKQRKMEYEEDSRNIDTNSDDQKEKQLELPVAETVMDSSEDKMEMSTCSDCESNESPSNIIKSKEPSFDNFHCDIKDFCQNNNNPSTNSLQPTKIDKNMIKFPNIGNQENVTLEVPAKRFLPEGIAVAESLQFNVREHQNKYSEPRFEGSESECGFSYEEWVRSKNKVQATNWKEYKIKMVEVQKSLNTDSPALPLWQGEVTPLIQPEEATSTTDILKKLQVIQQCEDDYPMKSATSLPVDSKFKISFDVYLPDAKFKKSDPGKPNHRVCVTRSCEETPSLFEIQQSTLRDGVPVHWAVLDNGEIAFYSFNEINLPCDVVKG